MKARKTLTLLLLAALTLAACKYDDSALWEQVNQNTEELAAQAARIAALEAWQAETNTNIEALQTLLSTTDYITAVTPGVKDGVEVGFTISFLNTPAITIYHGTKGDKGDKGDTPQIGATQADDGNWYWTLNGELLTDADGNPIRANGTQGGQGDQGPAGDDAPLPQLATGKKLNEQQITTDSQNKDIGPDAIYLSVDGGQTWTRVSGEDGEKGDTGDTGPKGDSVFESVDTKNADYVIFKLANNGGTFQVPRYTGIGLTFDVPGVSLPYRQTAQIQCIVTGIDNPTADDLYLITVPDGWKASISVDLILTVIAPADITSGAATGEILVMLDNKKGSTTIGRITVFCGTELTIGNLQPGQLATLIGSRIDLKSSTDTSGEINDDDWAAVKSQGSLTDLDLAQLRSSVSLLHQEAVLFTGTIRENIRYGRPDASDAEVEAAARAARCDHFIHTLAGGYDFMINEEGTNLSQGQRQLVTIARAILADRPALILDEATSNVDTRTEELIQRAMDALMQGRTSFVIAHRLSTIRNADVILVIRDGDIVEKGTHDELLAQGGFYADLYNSQFDEAA